MSFSLTVVFAVDGGRCHARKAKTSYPREISPGSLFTFTVKMPAVTRDKEDSESSEDEQE